MARKIIYIRSHANCLCGRGPAMKIDLVEIFGAAITYQPCGER